MQQGTPIIPKSISPQIHPPQCSPPRFFFRGFMCRALLSVRTRPGMNRRAALSFSGNACGVRRRFVSVGIWSIPSFLRHLILAASSGPVQANTDQLGRSRNPGEGRHQRLPGFMVHFFFSNLSRFRPWSHDFPLQVCNLGFCNVFSHLRLSFLVSEGPSFPFPFIPSNPTLWNVCRLSFF